MTINQRGYAFPYEYSYNFSGGGGPAPCAGFGGSTTSFGLTKREYAAIEAMKGLLAGSETSVEFAAFALGIPVKQYNPLVHWVQYIAKRAAAHADALFDQLEDPAPIEFPVGTNDPRPVDVPEGALRETESEDEYEIFTGGKWERRTVMIVKGGEGGTADKPAGRGEIYVDGVLYPPDHPDYDEMLKKVCNFGGSFK